MLTTNQKILAAALTTALLGGTVGAFIARSPKTNNNAPVPVAATTTQNETQSETMPPTSNDLKSNSSDTTANDTATGQRLTAPNAPNEINTATAPKEGVYRNGFDDGYQAAREQKPRANVASESASPRTVTRTRYVDDNGRRRYSYEEPRRPSWAQRHRDILTVAGGAGGGALIGGLIGGKKGAGIGALAGGGGGALYTYKLRHRNRRY